MMLCVTLTATFLKHSPQRGLVHFGHSSGYLIDDPQLTLDNVGVTRTHYMNRSKSREPAISGYFIKSLTMREMLPEVRDSFLVVKVFAEHAGKVVTGLAEIHCGEMFSSILPLRTRPRTESNYSQWLSPSPAIHQCGKPVQP